MPQFPFRKTAFVLSLAAGLAAHAQTAPAGPVKLELKLKAGQSRTFRVTVDTDMAATLPGGVVKKTNTRSAGTFEMTVDRVNPDGGFSVRVKPVSQSISVDGQDKTPDDVPDTEVRANISTDGRFSDVTGGKKAGDAPTTVMDAEDFLNTVFDKTVGFPAKSLSVGQGWADQIDSPLDESQPKVTLNNKLMALDTLNGKSVARVLHVLAEPIVDPKPQEGVAMSGTIEGGGLGTVDLASGLVLDEQDILRLKLDVQAQNPNNTSQTLTLGSVTNIQNHEQALPEAAPAAAA
jgi:hypothetical protein